MLNLAELPDQVQYQVNQLRERVAELHQELIRWQLVVWTAGNISGRVRCKDLIGEDLFVIKPSGVSYDQLTPQTMVVCTLAGVKIADGTPENLVPSSDTAAHAYVYSHMDHVGGVVHTHSSYATAWAARREPIPCALTMMADEFGGEIPVGPLAIIGDDSIGKGIVETLTSSRSRAVLMANHGPFTIGKDPKDAVKAAVMCEEVAKTVSIAQSQGQVVTLPDPIVDQLFDRYQNVYGQH